MKNMLKKIMVLVVAATLFVMPASTAYAEIIPVCTAYNANAAAYEYQPGPYIMRGDGHSILVHNYMNPTQKWNVKAGEEFIFAIFFNPDLGPQTGKLIIADNNGYTVATSQFTTSANWSTCQITIPPLTTDQNYTIALTSYTYMYIDSYMYLHMEP